MENVNKKIFNERSPLEKQIAKYIKIKNIYIKNLNVSNTLDKPVQRKLSQNGFVQTITFSFLISAFSISFFFLILSILKR